MPAISTGLAIGLGVASAGAGIAGSAIQAGAAGHAADVQSNAALQAAQLQHQDAQQALGFQQNVYGNQQQELAPYLQTGTTALSNLGFLMGLPGYQPQSAGGYAAPKVVTKPGGQGQTFSVAGSGIPGQPGFGGQGGNGFTLGGNRYTSAKALGLGQEGGFNTSTGALTAPTIKPGYTPPSNLASLVNPNLGGFGSLMSPFSEKFTAPTNVTEQNDPGYQFRLQQGQQALERGAAAKGDLFSGGTAKALEQYGQNYASNEYGNVYNRAMNEYLNRFNIYNQNQANQFNRLAALSGVGQTAAGQLASSGNQAAGNVSNIMLTSGQQIGNDLNNAAAARASGYVGGANAWSNALSGGTNNLMNLLLMSRLFGQNQGGGGGGQLSI